MLFESEKTSRQVYLSYVRPVDQLKHAFPSHREPLFFPFSGRLDASQQPLHQFLDKLPLRFVKRIEAQELLVEHPLKTGTQQQGRHSQRGEVPPDAFQALLRLRGVESKAPDKYAEAFYCRKVVV